MQGPILLPVIFHEFAGLVDNEFESFRQLGSGGMVAVYLVNDRILKKPFALKMLPGKTSKWCTISGDGPH